MLGVTMSAHEQYKTQAPAQFDATEARFLRRVAQMEPFTCPWPGCMCGGEKEIEHRVTNCHTGQHPPEAIE